MLEHLRQFRAAFRAVAKRCCLLERTPARPTTKAREPLHREIANLVTMTEDAKKAVVTIASIADDVSRGAYCERMRISDVQCRAAWLGLMDFILNAIRNNKVRRTAGAQSVLVWLTSP